MEGNAQTRASSPFMGRTCRTTSQLEDAHGHLKAYLLCRRGHLWDVVQSVDLLVKNQIHQYEAKLGVAYSKVPATVRDVQEFKYLYKRVTPVALAMLKMQLDLAKAVNYSGDCSEAFKEKFGMPCKHLLHDAMNSVGSVLKIRDVAIDQHWHFHPSRAGCEQPELPPLDPLPVKGKGRPRGSTAKFDQKYPCPTGGPRSISF